jgi:hypothetical protein
MPSPIGAATSPQSPGWIQGFRSMIDDPPKALIIA